MKPLSGLTVVVTRPQHQAADLAAMLATEGAEVLLFPVLEIRDLPDMAPLKAVIGRLASFDLAIFISPNAVARAMNLIEAAGGLPPKLAVAAVGPGSRRALAAFGVEDVLVPHGRADSEGLLSLPQLADVAGRRIVIFRGEGGREVLAETLRARGATVEYAECYRRVRPDIDAAPLLHRWARNEIHAVLLMSSESLHNFYQMIGRLGAAWLAKTPVFVPHARIGEAARRLGLEEVFVTAPGDAGLVAGLVAWAQTRFRAGEASGQKSTGGQAITSDPLE